ncbi:hypothetical protein BC941DRAFT_208433 [Chlamydoabsidia padenii]|nr:hypothetical protein BC941DRAFT_208433 [Chlamydoabsidia padenii]
MYQLDSIPRTDDLLYDIHSIQSILDDGIELLGTELTSKSQSWHEMGWQVDQDLWNTTKQQLEHLCIGLQHELSEEITKVGFTEKMMECTVCGLELMVSATELAGRTSLDLEHMDYCKPLVILFAQWTCKEMQQLKGQQQHLSTSTSRRTDLRLLQLLNNMTRVLVAFQMLVSRHHRSIDALASLLVDITIHVVSIMDQQLSNQNQSYIQRSNIMRTTFLPILYLEQSLVAFAEAVVALSDQNMPAYTQRIKWMSSLFD